MEVGGQIWLITQGERHLGEEVLDGIPGILNFKTMPRAREGSKKKQRVEVSKRKLDQLEASLVLSLSTCTFLLMGNPKI